MKKEHHELMELKHDPEPGYLKAFFIAVSIGVVYLAVIFLSS